MLPASGADGGVLYVADLWEPEGGLPVGADGILCPRLAAGDVLPAVGRIARAGFVLTACLHGAMLAQAYGVPWAPCARPVLPVNRFKWADWLAYLGVRAAPTFVVDLQEGRRGGSRTGRWTSPTRSRSWTPSRTAWSGKPTPGRRTRPDSRQRSYAGDG